MYWSQLILPAPLGSNVHLLPNEQTEYNVRACKALRASMCYYSIQTDIKASFAYSTWFDDIITLSNTGISKRWSRIASEAKILKAQRQQILPDISTYQRQILVSLVQASGTWCGTIKSSAWIAHFPSIGSTGLLAHSSIPNFSWG